MRRTIVTHLQAHGVEENVLAAILDHSPKTVTGKHYQRYDLLQEKRSALTLWTNLVMNAKAEVIPMETRR